MCLNLLFQCLFVGEEYYLANKFNENALSDLVLYINKIHNYTLIVLRYGTFSPRSSSLSFRGQNISSFTPSK